MPGFIAGQVGLFFFQAGASLAAVNAITTGVLIASQVAISIGLSAAGNALLRPRTPALKPSDVQTEIQNAVAPRRVTIGEMRVAGARFFGRTVEADPDTVWLGWVFNHGRISEILEFRVDDVPVVLDGAGEILTAPYKDNGSDEVHFILSRLGVVPETKYSELLTHFELDEVRGDGLFTALAKFNNWEDAESQIQVFPHNLPTVTTTARFAVMYDPRNPAHDRNDETTWEWSDNPAVFLLNYFAVWPEGWGYAWDRVEPNLAEWIAAMDVCDEQVALAAGGTESRYRMVMSYTLDQDPVAIVPLALSACDGRPRLKRDGTLTLDVGRWVEPTVVIDDGAIVAVENLTYGVDPLKAVAGIVGSYTSPDHGYKEQPIEPWPDAATVAAFTSDRTVSLDLTGSPSHGQGRRLAKRAYIRGNAPWRGTLVTNLAGLRAMDQPTITVRMAEPAIDITAEVDRFSFDPSTMTCSIAFASLDATIDDWDEVTEEGTAPPIPENRYFVPAAEGTAIGNMTSDGGLAACYNGVTNSATGACAKIGGGGGFNGHGYVGKTWDAPKAFSRAIIHGSNNQGFVENVNPAVTLTVYGKNGAAPAHATDGTAIGSLGFTEGSNESAGRQIESTDTVSKWDHWWVDIHNATSTDSLFCAEVRWWEQRPL